MIFAKFEDDEEICIYLNYQHGFGVVERGLTGANEKRYFQSVTAVLATNGKTFAPNWKIMASTRLCLY